MKISSLLFVSVVLTSAIAETVYITDELEFYTRSGPTTAYRIVGSVKSGEKVTVIEVNTESQFSKIKAEGDKEFWIESKFLSREPAAKEKVTILSAQVVGDQKKYQQELASLRSRVATNDELTQKIDNLTLTINSLEKDKEVLEKSNDSYKRQFQQEVFFAGAGVTLFGMLIGFIFSKFGGKKRRDLF